MRTIDVQEIADAVRQAVKTINIQTPQPVMIQLETILFNEPSPAGKMAMEDIVQNRRIAAARQMPMCQDTGMAIVFIELGQDVHLSGGDIHAAVTQGVRQGYEEGFLRKSIV